MKQIMVIHDPVREDRLALFRAEMKVQGIDMANVHISGAVYLPKACDGIAEAHKRCIRAAERCDFHFVIIMEDDVQFSDEGAWNYFIDAAVQSPANADIVLGGVYTAKGLKQVSDNLARVESFSGMHLYVIRRKAYKKVLAMPSGQHIDRWLSTQQDIIKLVTMPFAARQHSGFSDQLKKHVDYSDMLKGFKFFKSN